MFRSKLLLFLLDFRQIKNLHNLLCAILMTLKFYRANCEIFFNEGNKTHSVRVKRDSQYREQVLRDERIQCQKNLIPL